MGQMDSLSGFQERRLELADMIRAVLPIARAYSDERREQEIRTLLTRLAAGRFQLAVIGQFSRGKTTLMNALLGAAYLPMGALPMTSVVTTVRYGTRARALVRSHATALPIEVPIADVARFVARASAERTRMQVATVEVEVPAELLRLGFEFVDTPGVGSAITANTAATLRYLPQADAVVFVTGFDSALTRAEADFLRSAAGQAGKLFIVINKRDLVTDADAAAVTGYVQRWTCDNLPAPPPTFGVSALLALNGAVSRDLRQVTGSGIESLREELTRFLTAEPGQVALGNVAVAAAEIVARQQRDLQAWELSRSGNGHGAVLAGLDSSMTELEDQLTAVAERIMGTAEAEVTSFAAEALPAGDAQLTELLTPAAAASDGEAFEAGDDPVPGALEALRLAGSQAAGEWLGQRAAELRETLVAAAADDIGILLDLARSPREVGATTLGLPALAGAPAGWAGQDVPQLAIAEIEWIVPDPPPKRRRHRDRGGGASEARRAVSAAISNAVADFSGRAAAALQDAAADWARRLAEQARRLASAEAAQFQRYRSALPRDGDLAVLADLSGRLAGFRDSLAAWNPDGSRMAVGLGAEPRTAAVGGTCLICARLETTQTEYLIRRQLLLATSEADQARHADTGGFCPLHTWQYAHLASPVGISAGNARLTSHLASALRDAGAGSRDPGELARHIAGVARERACPACALLAETEQETAEEVAASPEAVPPRLCLRHLALVLQACPPLPKGRAMTSALTAALQRASENMRTYALKREALRRGLITAEEASACTDSLRLLVGLPSLAQPSQPD
jgi:hypothetical protein